MPAGTAKVFRGASVLFPGGIKTQIMKKHMGSFVLDVLFFTRSRRRSPGFDLYECSKQPFYVSQGPANLPRVLLHNAGLRP